MRSTLSKISSAGLLSLAVAAGGCVESQDTFSHSEAGSPLSINLPERSATPTFEHGVGIEDVRVRVDLETVALDNVSAEIDTSYIDYSKPDMGSYILEEVHFFDASGQPVRGENWIGMMKLSAPDGFTLELVEIVPGAAGDSFGQFYEVKDGGFDIDQNMIHLTDANGATVFSFEYRYARADLDKSRGHLFLSRTGPDRAGIEGQFASMRFTH
jgi:hypothetical protein